MNAVANLAERRATPGQSRAPVLAFASDRDTVDVVCRVVPGGRRGVEVREGGAAQALAAVQQAKAPELLIVDLSESSSPVADATSLATACGPGTTLVALGTENDVKLYRALLGAGVTDYLVKPVTAQELRRSILTAGRIEEKSDAQTRGHVAFVIGARGGVGASSVATGAAWLLANTYRKQVALIDLDLQFGTVALSLDLEPGNGLRSALENADRIDSLFVSSALQNVSETLFVMGGEEPLDESFAMQPEALERLVAELKKTFDSIIIELPRHSLAQAAPVVAASESVAVVTDLSIAGLRDSLRLRTGLAKIAPDAKLTMVANRVGLEKASEVSVKEFERGLNAKVDVLIPEEARAAKASLNGKPLAAALKSGKPAAAMDALAKTLGAIETAPKTWKWFGRR